MYRRTNLEKETVIVFNEAEKEASVSTYNSKLLRRLTELTSTRDDCQAKGTCTDGSADFTIPKAWIRVNPPREVAPLSEEQKATMRQRMAKARAASNLRP